MYNELTKLLLESYSRDTAKRRVGRLHLPGSQEGFLQGISQETALKIRKSRRIERWFADMDGRLFEQQK